MKEGKLIFIENYLENSDEQISQTSLPWVYILAGTGGGEKEQKINIATVIAKQITYIC